MTSPMGKSVWNEGAELTLYIVHMAQNWAGDRHVTQIGNEKQGMNSIAVC